MHRTFISFIDRQRTTADTSQGGNRARTDVKYMEKVWKLLHNKVVAPCHPPARSQSENRPLGGNDLRQKSHHISRRVSAQQHFRLIAQPTPVCRLSSQVPTKRHRGEKRKTKPKWSSVIFILVFGIALRAFVKAGCRVGGAVPMSSRTSPHNTSKGAFRDTQSPRGRDVLYCTLDHV